MATYYIDPENGFDSNDGRSELYPARTMGFTTILPGDTINFKRGSFIRGRLSNLSGDSGYPITYAAYGQGENPVFCGSINIKDSSIWEEEKEHIWICRSDKIQEVANLIFNGGTSYGTLRWTKEELQEQGDFYDNQFGVNSEEIQTEESHALYLYSIQNPGMFYSGIECCTSLYRTLANNGHDMIIRDLQFINNGLHGIAGAMDSRNVLIENCHFKNIGGAVYARKRKIRFGNAVEFWNVAENIEIKNCFFDNIYDSAITHQGGEDCKPCVQFHCHHNIFLYCGMASYEQRDRLPICSSFTDNICLNAGEGFSKNGEIMPRHSEIWPRPMGHHVFLWRIHRPENQGSLVISHNIFGNAPYGAAIYSIIDSEAEQQIERKGNSYYWQNHTLLSRWQGIDFYDFSTYREYEPDSVYIHQNLESIFKSRLKYESGAVTSITKESE